MFRIIVKSAIFFSAMLFVVSCSQERKTDRGFHYWKSDFVTNNIERETISNLQVKKIYVKFFDVTWNNRVQRPEPAAKIRFDSTSLRGLKQAGTEIIPVVLITNETFEQIIPESINSLGDRISFLLKGLLEDNLITTTKEIQIDCDWTESTKDKYFELLKYLKLLPLFSNKQLSVVIPLYQCKNSGKVGIPPCNRGMLMCYNMGNLTNPETNNSIIDASELRKYADNLNSYPLPLDIALPIFEWAVLFRNNMYSGVLQNLPDSVLHNASLFKASTTRFESLSDTIVSGHEFKKGDMIRFEESRYDEILKTAGTISPQLITPSFTVSLYHLDSVSLSKFKKEELETIYNSLHKK